MVNLGGGMVTDLGGFAASTFKRGIKFINIPTTILSMVDASVGGKTGVNFGGLKNEIGVFNNADYVILDTVFLKTMDEENLCSGYAEMLKHGLINNEEMWAELVNYDIHNPDLSQLQRMVAESVAVKERIVLEDPLEHGIRKALNVGHTMGHAFESFAMKRTPILHGYAVAVHSLWSMTPGGIGFISKSVIIYVPMTMAHFSLRKAETTFERVSGPLYTSSLSSWTANSPQ